MPKTMPDNLLHYFGVTIHSRSRARSHTHTRTHCNIIHVYGFLWGCGDVIRSLSWWRVNLTSLSCSFPHSALIFAPLEKPWALRFVCGPFRRKGYITNELKQTCCKRWTYVSCDKIHAFLKLGIWRPKVVDYGARLLMGLNACTATSVSPCSVWMYKEPAFFFTWKLLRPTAFHSRPIMTVAVSSRHVPCLKW